MNAHLSKIVGEGLTYDDVLLIPRGKSLKTRLFCVARKD